LVIPVSKSEEYKKKCKELFGDRLIIFNKQPSVRKLLFTLIDSFETNPSRFEEIDLELVKRNPGQLEKDTNGHDHDHSNCDHDHGHDHGHNHGHNHHAGCNHDHDPEEEIKNRRKMADMMKIVSQDPLKSLSAIQKGNTLFLSAIMTLCSFGTSIPKEFKSPLIQDGSGYPAFFAENGGIESLINQTQRSATLVFHNPDLQKISPRLEQQRLFLLFNTLQTILGYQGPEGRLIRDEFVKFGGIELLRGVPFKTQFENGEDEVSKGFRFPGILRETDIELRGVAEDIFRHLTTHQQMFRKCDYCGKREENFGSWKQYSAPIVLKIVKWQTGKKETIRNFASYLLQFIAKLQ
ncbi:hypothetical protein HK096_002658, partial [Nowakowskiella sp. JEL0078]